MSSPLKGLTRDQIKAQAAAKRAAKAASIRKSGRGAAAKTMSDAHNRIAKAGTIDTLHATNSGRIYHTQRSTVDAASTLAAARAKAIAQRNAANKRAQSVVAQAKAKAGKASTSATRKSNKKSAASNGVLPARAVQLDIMRTNKKSANKKATTATTHGKRVATRKK